MLAVFPSAVAINRHVPALFAVSRQFEPAEITAPKLAGAMLQLAVIEEIDPSEYEPDEEKVSLLPTFNAPLVGEIITVDNDFPATTRITAFPETPPYVAVKKPDPTALPVNMHVEPEAVVVPKLVGVTLQVAVTGADVPSE